MTLAKHEYVQEPSGTEITAGFDYLMRVTGSGPIGTLQITHLEETNSFRIRVQDIDAQNKTTIGVLSKAVDSLYRSLEYNGFYNSLLCGQISEGEFEQLARDFVYEPDDQMALIDVKKAIRILLFHTTSDYTCSDLVEILNCDVDLVNQAMLALREEHSSTDYVE